MELPITPLRTSIDAYVSNGFIGEVSGVSILERRNSVQDHVDALNCLSYAMRKYGNLELDIFFQICPIWAKGFQLVENPHSTDLAVYIQSESPHSEQVHIGIIRPNNQVESKWGYDHVMLHDFGAVPTGYGNLLLFFRK